MANLTAELRVKFAAQQSGGNDFGGPSFSPTIEKILQFSNGTGADQADLLWADERTLAASASEDLDLAGVLADAFGATLGMAEVVMILVIAAAANTNNVVVGGSKQREGDFAGEIKRVRELTAALVAETSAMAGLNPLVEDYGFALEKARIEQDLLAAAQQQGLAITPALKLSISELATGYAQATAAAALLDEQQDRVRAGAEEMRSLGKDLLGGFISDLRNGVTAAEALQNALAKVADKLIEVGLNSIFDGKKKSGGGIGGFLSGLLSSTFHDGGVVGQGGPKRMVSPLAFAGAPRFHRGGEVPAILRPGEIVDPGDGSQFRKHFGGGGKQDVAINVNVAGANGDQHVVALVQQGVRAGLTAYDKNLDRTIGGKVQLAQVRYG